MTTPISPISHKSVCIKCGKCELNGGKCHYEDQSCMSYCPTFIRKRVDYKRPLTASPFKQLEKFHIGTKR